MSQKTILSIFTGDDWHAQEAQTGKYTEIEYRAWRDVAKPMGVQLLRASVRWFKRGRFVKYWRQTSDGWEKSTRPVRPTLVYDRTRTFEKKTGRPIFFVKQLRQEISRALPLFNVPEFSEVMDNKLYQAMIFRKWMPKTRVWVAGQTVPNPQGKWIVLKQPEGSAGLQVYITRKKRFPVDKTLLQQEFVPATHNGQTRDLRIMFIGNQPQYAFHRVAPKGSLYTNVYLGAKVEMVPLSEIRPILKLSKEIARPLAVFPKKIFTLDFLVHHLHKKPFLIETNTMPGTDTFSQALLHKILRNLTRHLIER